MRPPKCLGYLTANGLARLPRLLPLGLLPLALALTVSFTLSLRVPPGLGVQFSDGRSQFIGIPRLLRVASNRSEARVWGGRYELTVQVPDNADEGLAALEIGHRQGADASLRYDLGRSSVQVVAPGANAAIALNPVSFDRETQTLRIPFTTPIPPGQTITLSIYPVVTPSDGILLLGVTAIPAGAKPVPQFIGHGRLHFHSPDYWQRR